ncbi:hypothetical protein H4S06_002057 [Coemansia sp. BCRC 34490]|nr:hypothetical protein H4S06_002057 [Coemansia sp. BCRC 34490]
MQEFPILAGQLKTDANNRMYIKVNKDDLNMPVYTDTCCNLEYSDMQESGFNIHKLPVSLSGEYGVPVSSRAIGGRIKPAYFHVFRFKNNSGLLLFVSVAHYAVDGYGCSQFISRWAEISRWMQQTQSGNSVEQLPIRQYTFDRSIHDSYCLKQANDLDALTFEGLATRTLFSRWLAWISPEMRGRVFKLMSNKTSRKCSFFHISAKTMDDLRARVQAHAPEGIRYTANDVISAYLTIVIGQAKEKAFEDKWKKPLRLAVRALSGNKLGKHRDLVTTIDMNIRPRVNNPDAMDFTGNMVMGRSIVFSQNEVQQEPVDKAVSELALRINQAMSSVDLQYLGQVWYLQNKESDSYMWPTWCYAKNSNKLVVSNQARFAHYSIDFGAGSPDMVRHAPHSFRDAIFIMPDNPATGGYIFEFKLEPVVEANLVCNKDWMSLVDKYDSYM